MAEAKTDTKTRRASGRESGRAGQSASRRSDAGDDKRKPSRRPDASKGGARRVALIVLAVVVFALVLLYPVGRDYYQAMRTDQRLQAQIDAVNARNEAVKAENDALQTEEGIENQARTDLGWVKEGESAAVVTNNEGSIENASKLPDRLDVQSITAPKTWYYTILDTIFFVRQS